MKWIVCGCLALSLGAQPLRFDVASIKPDPSLPLMKIGPGFDAHGASFTGSKVTLLDLVMSAYDVTAPRVIGPGWLDGDRFDVAAKAPQGTSRADLRAMAQTMLKERFHLDAHMETREMPVYDLVVAKGGVKMMDRSPTLPDGTPVNKRYPNMKGVASLSGTFVTAQLADSLSYRVGRPIVDKTGLDKQYYVSLSWTTNLPSSGDDQPELGPPDLFGALQQDLGLKLEPSKAELTVVVVNHMERMPTEN